MSQPGPALPLRQALGRYATGVTLLTCRAADGHPVGLTVNSFASASLDPPLVTWCLRLASPNLAAFDAASHFAVNVLAADQEALSRRFAQPVSDKFALGAWRDGPAGLPLLEDAAARFVCLQRERLDLGDHRLFVGEVLHHSADPARAPLVFHDGRYRVLSGEPTG